VERSRGEVTQRRKEVALDFSFRLSCPARCNAKCTRTLLPGKKGAA